MHQNIGLGSNGVDRVSSLRKIPMRLCGTKFCTSSARFAPSFVRQPNGPKCTQMVLNSPKHEFRVQWGGSGAFVAKNVYLGSIGVDWGRSLRKIPTRLRGTNFFWGVLYYLGAFGTVSLPYETRCKTGRTSAKDRKSVV